MAKISKQEFEKTLISLEEALAECQLHTAGKTFRLLRDASIQRFEFCVELAWKVAGKTLGTIATSPKPVLREMLSNGLISNIEVWFDFLEARNKSSHSYDEEVAREIYAQLANFVTHARDLLAKL